MGKRKYFSLNFIPRNGETIFCWSFPNNSSEAGIQHGKFQPKRLKFGKAICHWKQGLRMGNVRQAELQAALPAALRTSSGLQFHAGFARSVFLGILRRRVWTFLHTFQTALVSLGSFTNLATTTTQLFALVIRHRRRYTKKKSSLTVQSRGSHRLHVQKRQLAMPVSKVRSGIAAVLSSHCPGFPHDMHSTFISCSSWNHKLQRYLAAPD